MTRIYLVPSSGTVVIGGDNVTPLHAGYNSPQGGNATLSVNGALSVLSTTNDHRIWKNSQSNVLSICNQAQYGDSAIKFQANDRQGNREQCAIGFNTERSDASTVFQGVAFWESSNYINGDFTLDETRPWIGMHVVQTGTFSATTAAGHAVTGGFSSYLRLQFDPSGNIAMYGVSPNVVRWSMDADGVVYMHSAPVNPVNNPTNGGFLYIDTTGHLTYRGLSGTVTVLANP